MKGYVNKVAFALLSIMAWQNVTASGHRLFGSQTASPVGNAKSWYVQNSSIANAFGIGFVSAVVGTVCWRYFFGDDADNKRISGRLTHRTKKNLNDDECAPSAVMPRAAALRTPGAGCRVRLDDRTAQEREVEDTVSAALRVEFPFTPKTAALRFQHHALARAREQNITLQHQIVNANVSLHQTEKLLLMIRDQQHSRRSSKDSSNSSRGVSTPHNSGAVTGMASQCRTPSPVHLAGGTARAVVTARTSSHVAAAGH